MKKDISQMIDWKHPLVSGNPFLMPMMWQMGIMQTLMEAKYVGPKSKEGKDSAKN
jgi:hypothetical protein